METEAKTRSEFFDGEKDTAEKKKQDKKKQINPEDQDCESHVQTSE